MGGAGMRPLDGPREVAPVTAFEGRAEPIDSARLARFELATPGFVGRCSIQMSYSRS